MRDRERGSVEVGGREDHALDGPGQAKERLEGRLIGKDGMNGIGWVESNGIDMRPDTGRPFAARWHVLSGM